MPHHPRDEAGRFLPLPFDQETADRILTLIAEGESVRAICRRNDMPHMVTVFRWLARNEAFAAAYREAMEIRAAGIFDEMLEIADDGTNDWMERESEGAAGWALNGEHVQRSRLRIDARKWVLGRMNPKKYGDRQALEHSGPDGGPIETRNTSVEALLDEARRLGISPEALGLGGGASKAD